MKRKLLWALSILSAAILYLFENNAGTLTLLVGVIAVPVFGLLGLAGPAPAVEIRLSGPVEKGQTVCGTLSVANTGRMPLPGLKLRMVCRNLRTGEQTQTPLELSLLPRQKMRMDFRFDCPCCGIHRVSVEGAKRSDLFGLFFREAGCGAAGEITVLPRMFETWVSLESTDMAMPESDLYSSAKPGSDPGETFAVREYVPGDAIRKLHWKLSEKTDKMMVREFGLPVVNEAALLLETAGAESAEENDAVTEVFASLSSALLESGVPHRVFWQDGVSGGLREFPVTDAGEFAFMLSELLALPPAAEGSVARCFTQVYPHCAYSHVIVVGGRIPAGIRDLYNGNRVSVLLPRRNTVAEGLQSDGTHVLTFDVRDYAAQLCRLEV